MQQATESRERLDIRNIRIFTKYIPDPNVATGVRAEHWAKWNKVGDNHVSEISDAIKRLKGGLVERADGSRKLYNPAPIWHVVEPYYDAFLKNEEVPLSGTPLDAWPALDQDTLHHAKAAGFQTVQQLAEAKDFELKKLNLPSARAIQAKAQLYLEALGDQQKLEQSLSSRDEQIRNQTLEIEKLKDMIHKMVEEKNDVKPKESAK